VAKGRTQSYLAAFARMAQKNPDLDLATFDFFDSAAVEGLDWRGLDREEVLPGLQARQRLVRVAGNSFACDLLAAGGYDSAHSIGARAEDVFAEEWKNVLPGGEEGSRAIHRKAVTVRGQVIHLWAALHGTIAACQSATLPTFNIPIQFESFFTGLPTYRDLFGPGEFCDCQHCNSIFGPAAYFVDLMRITDRYIAKVNEATIPKEPLNLLLSERRPKLFTLPLTCSATNDLVPYLQIVNEVMAVRLAPGKSMSDVFRELAVGQFPFNLPANIALAEIRLYVQSLKTSLAEIFVQFGPDPAPLPTEEAAARERLSLSLEQYQFATTASIDVAVLKERYGLAAEQDLSVLNQVPVFLLQTGLMRDAFAAALDQNLNAAERDAGLAHRFFFNAVLPDNKAVSIRTADDDSETITNLTPQTLDRLNRFIRLAQWSGIPFADLDWFLASFNAAEIGSKSLQQVASALLVGAVYELPSDATAALWADMKTIGVGGSQAPADLFDRVYNKPSLLKGAAPYHPLYTKNSLYKDRVVEWDLEKNVTDSASFSRARLAAALGLSETTLTSIGQALFGETPKVVLDVPNLSALYRTAQILDATGLSISEFVALLPLLDLTIEALKNPANLLALMRTVRLLGVQGLSAGDLNYILTGDQDLSDALVLEPATLYEGAKTTWALSQPQLVASTSLVADVIDADEAAEAFALLLKNAGILLSVRSAYERVFGQPLGSDIALVLTRVTAQDLECLKPKFSQRQIKVVVRVLQQAYDAQFSLLERQLATLFDSKPKTAEGLSYYFSKAVEVRPYLALLLTPQPFDEAPGKWPEVERLLLNLARATFAADTLQLKDVELRCIADHPLVFSLPQDRLLSPPFAAVAAVFTLHTLKSLWNAKAKDFLTFLSMPPDQKCSKGKKSKALAKLSGTDQAQICQLSDYLGKGPDIYNSLAGLARLQECRALLSLTGMDAFSIQGVLSLRDLPASEAKWTQWLATAGTMAALANAKNEAEWTRIDSGIVSQLNEQKRDLILWRLLWTLRQKDPRFVRPRQVSDLLLIDVERSGCADISFIVEGLNAVQLYLQRCRLNLEPGVVKIPIPEVWWEWMMNYRVWEANRRIFLYPENYLIPSLRKSRTALFRGLEESLQQSDLSPAQVAPAYKTYLDGLASLATLTCVDVCRYVVDDVKRGPQDTLFLFARTQAEPYVYYYARKEGDAGWSEWKKVDGTIGSRYVSPVYGFNRLFLFWVELKANSNSKIKAEGDQHASISQNEMVYTATIRYTFYDFNGQWVSAQTLYSDDVTYVAPSKTPFDDSSGYELFDMESLYWRKVNVLRLAPEVIRDRPENTVAAEKLTVFYGPFLNNNINQIDVKLPERPDTSRASGDPARFQFEDANYQAAIDLQQALSTTVRGPMPLRNATTMNGDLNRDFLLRTTEFPVLQENQSPGVPPAVAPKVDRPTSQLAVAPSFNVLRTNYDGDYTSRIDSAALSRLVTKASFAASGLNADRSSGIFSDLQALGILGEDGRVSALFNRNSNLRSLFPDDLEVDALRFIAVVQGILFGLRAAGMPANSQSFLLDPIDATLSGEVFSVLVDRKIVDQVGRVSQLLTSTTDLSFLFPRSTEPQKGRLTGEVRRVLFFSLGDPVLLESIAQETAAATMVKNQPGWFVFNNGNEAFLIAPDAPVLPMISANVKVVGVPSKPNVHPDTFVTPDIPRVISEQIIADLKGEGIVNKDNQVIDFSARTDLSFVLEGEKEPRRGIQVAEAREILLGLPSITGFRYYFEMDDTVLKANSFVGPGIDPEASAQVLAALQVHKIVDDAGIISNTFSSSTNLDFLFPKADPETRRVLIRQVRVKLFEAYTAVWQTALHDLKFRFVRLTTGAIGRLSRSLFAGGIPSLLSLKSQQIPVVSEIPFSRYRPTWRVIPPSNFDGAQADFEGTFGTYFWELFFYSPQLIAANLLANRRFQEALTWLQYIFNPTLRPEPLTPEMFITPDIPLELAAQAFGQLKEKQYITADDSVSATFRADTPLDFLWPQLPLREKETRIRQVRNVLLNNQVSRAASRFWQFQPFRNHSLEELLKILTDPVQIAAYNNDPFDPFAIARLRIGAFEKAIFMNYLDTLIAWGDSLFAQYSWESLTAASMLYFYAQDLLGTRPASPSPCPNQPSTTFAKIKEKYDQLSDGIPQFLIFMENLLPSNDIVAPSLAGHPFTDIDPYFCVPENTQLLAYWDKVEDRLYKIRRCLDLEGRPRQLALFQPPINPLELVRAAASGQSSFSVLEQQQLSILPYRFTVMLSTARSLVATASSLGNSLFSALQSRDSEALARLRARNEIDVLNLTTLTKTQQIEAARLTVDGLVESAKAIEDRRKFYDDLADEFMNPLEIVNLAASAVALHFQVVSGVMTAASSIAHAAPQVGSPFAMTYGGIQLGDALDAVSQMFQVYSQVAEFVAGTTLTVAGYQRRAQEWRFSADQASIEAVSTQKQIAAAQQQLATAQREMEIHIRTIENNKKEAEFLTTRFDTQELYVWMAGRLSTLYFETYRIALDAALATQSAYRFELDKDDTFINLDYWDNLRQGLLAAESLELSLDRMEAAYLRYSGRRLMIDKTLSLVSFSPAELFRLKQTGVCTISLTEALLDLDFPGHYCRQIQGVALSVLDSEGEPFSEIHGTLTQIRNDVVLAPDESAVKYLLKPDGNPPTTIRTNWQASQQIAVYSGGAVTGVGTEIDSIAIAEDRYYPFEGTGAVSEWLFSLPLATNSIVFQEISDVQLTVRYFALNGGAPFPGQVEKLLGGEILPGGISIALKQYVGEEDWKAFVDSKPQSGIQTLAFAIDGDLVPPNVQTATLLRLDAQLDVASDVPMPPRSDPAFMTLTIEKVPVEKPLVLDKVYASVAFQPGIPKKQFLDSWRLDVNVGSMAGRPGLKDLLRPDGRLDPDRFLELKLFLAYKGCVFGCR
jgi:Tc toxin complex TcA C-terminal TcB-binding domain/Neuraminidase-like domain/Salmonella virulence plasmid 28.1kDa A protein